MIYLFETSGVSISLKVLLLLMLAAFLAGWIDAVVGGGGLLQLPALLLLPGITPVEALATNKFASVFGTATSSITYYRRLKPNLKLVLPSSIVALLGAVFGASVAVILPSKVFLPIIIVALTVVALITVLKPRLGTAENRRFDDRVEFLIMLGVGLFIGFYDGVLGPGTGTFFIFALAGIVGLEFLQAGSYAKILNFATNLGALILFIPAGAVLWKLAIVLAFANTVGSFVGSLTAIKKGNTFIRVFLLIVVVALIVRLAFFQ